MSSIGTTTPSACASAGRRPQHYSSYRGNGRVSTRFGPAVLPTRFTPFCRKSKPTWRQSLCFNVSCGTFANQVYHMLFARLSAVRLVVVVCCCYCYWFCYCLRHVQKTCLLVDVVYTYTPTSDFEFESRVFLINSTFRNQACDSIVIYTTLFVPIGPDSDT